MSATFTIEAASAAEDGARVCALPAEFALERGGVLHGAQLGYELAGPEAGPLVLALGGISAGRHVTTLGARRGFWDGLAGPGRALDTQRVRVLGVDWLGGIGLSTGPRSSGLGARFPVLTPRDQARALAILLAHLGEERFELVVGASFGGQVAQALAADAPETVGELVLLCCAHAPDPLASAWRAVQRELLELGARAGDASWGVRIARKLAMTTYRGRAEWSERGAAASEWLAARARDFAERFDADAYRVLSRAIDEQALDAGRIRCRTTLVGFDSDLLVPIEQVRELARRLGERARLFELASRFGHDGFLKETAAIDAIVRPIVDALVAKAVAA